MREMGGREAMDGWRVQDVATDGGRKGGRFEENEYKAYPENLTNNLTRQRCT